jgi:hypothetical protein
MVIAECIVITLLIVVVWNMVAAAATQHPGVAVQTLATPAGDATSPVPDLTETKKAAPGPLPGLNVDAGFWRFRLGRLNQDQVVFEQLEWRILHNAMDAAQHYVETVVLPSIVRAERPT